MKLNEKNTNLDESNDLQFKDLSKKVMNYMASELEKDKIDVTETMVILRILAVANSYRSLQIVMKSFANQFSVLDEFLKFEGAAGAEELSSEIKELVNKAVENDDPSLVNKIIEKS